MDCDSNSTQFAFECTEGFGVLAVNSCCFYFQEFRQFEADGTSQRQEKNSESKDCAEFVFMSLMQGR